MAIHELKTNHEPFQAVWDGRKTFEFRRDDREPRFALGDWLRLREWVSGVPEGHDTGRTITARVSYVARGQFEVPAGYVVLSLTQLTRSARNVHDLPQQDPDTHEPDTHEPDTPRIGYNLRFHTLSRHEKLPGDLTVGPFRGPLTVVGNGHIADPECDLVAVFLGREGRWSVPGRLCPQRQDDRWLAVSIAATVLGAGEEWLRPYMTGPVAGLAADYVCDPKLRPSILQALANRDAVSGAEFYASLLESYGPGHPELERAVARLQHHTRTP